MAQSHCSIHNTFPLDGEPCWQCVNPILEQRNELLEACKESNNVLALLLDLIRSTHSHDSIYREPVEKMIEINDAAISKAEA